MNICYLAAALLTAIATAAHGILPEMAMFRNILGVKLPLPTLPQQAQFLMPADPDKASAQQWAFLRACWHFLTFDGLLTTVLLVLAAFGKLPGAAAVAITTAIRLSGYSLIWVLFVAPVRHGLLRAPQWLLLAAIAALAGLGSLQK